MPTTEPNTEVKAKIILDEANLAFCEIAERKDQPGERTPEGSAWDSGKMDGEFDESDYQKILDLQAKAARICDDNPDLEDKTGELFQKITADNASELLKEISEDINIMELARISITVFLLRFPSAQSFINKGHPLVMASDDYMLQNADAQNWSDYNLIAREFGWI